MSNNLPLIPDDIQEIPDDLIDRLNNYYNSGKKLQPGEIKICERLEAAFALLCESRNRAVAVDKHQKTQHISRAQAYLDMANAERLFAPLRKYSKDFLRLITIESARRDIERCEARLDAFEMDAKKRKDVYHWRVLMQEKSRAEERLIKAAGLDRADQDLPDPSKYKQHLIQINASPEAIAAIQKAMEPGVVDLDDYVQDVEIIEEDDNQGN